MSSRRISAGLLAIVVGVAVCYFNALFGPFQFDDYNVIVFNPAITEWPPNLGGLRPLLKLSYALNWLIDPAAFGFHVFNVLLHALNSLLVYVLGSRVAGQALGAAGRRAALAGALLFALHPVNTEAVTYISGRSTSLMTLFYLGSVLVYLRGHEKRQAWAMLILSPLLFVLALLVKETAATLPFVLLLWHVSCGRTGHAEFNRQWVHWAVLVVALAVMLVRPAYRDLIILAPDMDTLRTQVEGISYLLSRWFVLNGLNIDPDLRLQPAWNAALAAKSTMLILMLAGGVWSLRARPWWGFGLLWLFLQLLPGNSLILRWDIANERQLYLAGVGVFMAMGVELELQLARRHRNVLMGVVLLLLLVFTLLRNQDYRSEVALWEDTVRGSPHKARAHNNLGEAYRLAGMPQQARASFERALSLDPDYLLAANNLRALATERDAEAVSPATVPAPPSAGKSLPVPDREQPDAPASQ